MAADYDFDYLVIGGGSGGVRSARVAARYGAKVGIVEQAAMGGTCVNVGCVPKKLYYYAAHMVETWRHAPYFGWQTESEGATEREPQFNLAILWDNVRKEIQRLNGIYAGLLEKQGVTTIQGRAQVIDAHTIVVDDRQWTARYLLIATGSTPVRPEGIEPSLYGVSDDVFAWQQVPERLLMVGGGYIAVELAGIFSRLGAKVTLVYRGELFLRGFDRDLRMALAESMRRHGIDLRFETEVASLTASSADVTDDDLGVIPGVIPGGDFGGIEARLSTDETITVDQVVYAIGRRPNTQNLGLERAGVVLDQQGRVRVDDFLRTDCRNIFAVGDCANHMNLTPVATAEGMAVAETLFNQTPTTMDYGLIPSAIFSQPSIGTVGMTEEAARQKYGQIDVYRSTFRAMDQSLVPINVDGEAGAGGSGGSGGGGDRVIMKLIVDQATDRVVGAHMLGDQAGEIIQGVAVAMRCRATKNDFDRTIGIHPTSAEEFVTMRQKISE